MVLDAQRLLFSVSCGVLCTLPLSLGNLETVLKFPPFLVELLIPFRLELFGRVCALLLGTPAVRTDSSDREGLCSDPHAHPLVERA